MISNLRLKAYGKLNLGLDVLGRRTDGYHEVRMVMQTVLLHDSIEMSVKKESGIHLETNLFYLPVNEQNLAYRAAKLLMDEFGFREGVSIRLRKFIPVAAGMAGGSADAAAVLYGINRMFSLGLDKTALMERALTLGADVPYCLMGGTALAEGIGEKLTPLPPMPQCAVVIAKPGVNVSTKMVYERFDALTLSKEDHPDIDGLAAAITHGDLAGAAARFKNVLEFVTAREYPVIKELEETMRAMGAMVSVMSGSGPTVFGLFTQQEQARRVYEALRATRKVGLARQVYLTGFYNRPGC